MSSEKKVFLFVDGSVNPQKNIGFGAYLLFNEHEIGMPIKKTVNIKKFLNTSSTKLELETLLWALNDISPINYEIIILTDCQNIIGLQSRRERYETSNYMSKTHKQIKNHELYKEFYKMTDILSCTFVKIKGHKKQSMKDEFDKIFTLVDRASRNALREEMQILG